MLEYVAAETGIKLGSYEECDCKSTEENQGRNICREGKNLYLPSGITRDRAQSDDVDDIVQWLHENSEAFAIKDIHIYRSWILRCHHTS